MVKYTHGVYLKDGRSYAAFNLSMNNRSVSFQNVNAWGRTYSFSFDMNEVAKIIYH